MLPVGLNGLFHLQFPESSQCDKRVEEDGQQTETTMVPTTFTKHLVTVRGLKNNRTPRKAKRACTQNLTEMEGLQLLFSAVPFETPLERICLAGQRI